VLLPALACAQATVEYAAGAAAASTASAGAKAAGKSIAGALEKLNKNLDDGAATGSQTVTPTPATRTKSPARKSATAATTAKTQAAAPATPPPSYEDPTGIQQGMLYDDVVHRFGPPAIAMTTAPGEQTLTYAKKGASFDVKVVNGKVSTVQKTGGA
jgi:hypothetical protein